MKAFPVSIRPFPVLLAAGAGILLFNVADVIARAPGAEPVESTPVNPSSAAKPQPAAQLAASQQAASAQQVAKASVPQNRVEADLMNDMAGRAPRAKPVADRSDLEMRERMLEAAEKRVDAKIAELRRLEARLKQLTGVQDEQSAKQFTSLVKVYETMKPKDAARIFEKLDLGVQLAVANRMKETKMAAILAEMDPDAAKSLTMALAQRANVAG